MSIRFIRLCHPSGYNIGFVFILFPDNESRAKFWNVFCQHRRPYLGLCVTFDLHIHNHPRHTVI